MSTNNTINRIIIQRKILEHELEIIKLKHELLLLDKDNKEENINLHNDSDNIIVHKKDNNQDPYLNYLNSNINNNQDIYIVEYHFQHQLERFIKNNFGPNSLDRLVRLKNKCGFRKYDTFIKHIIKQLNANSAEDTEFALALANKINRRKIRMADEEHCTIWDATVFYYNKKGDICIMHPR